MEKISRRICLAFLLFPLNLFGACLLPGPLKVERLSTHTLIHFKVSNDLLNSQTHDFPKGRFTRYQALARNFTDINPFALLKKQREIYKKFYGEDYPGLKQFDLLINRAVGKMMKVNCLIAGLYENHFKVRPDLKDSYSEFSALLTFRGKEVYVIQSTGRKGDFSAPPIPDLKEKITKLRRLGFKSPVHLHNHPFSFNNPYGDIAGTVIPSDPDLRFYEKSFSHGLKKAWITNGFDTLSLSMSEVRKLLGSIKHQN